MTDTLFSTREVPWMKMGKLAQTVQTAGEAAVLGGLDFTVSKRPMWYGDTDDTMSAVPSTRAHGRVAIVRNDTDVMLGIMSADYHVLQFGDAFDFMDQINPNFVAAGCLKDGSQGFMVVEGPDVDVVDDPHKFYIVLRTSHDGSRAVEVSVMPLRNMCMNQLTLSSMTVDAPARWAIKHTSSMKGKLADAHMSLQNVQQYADRYAGTAQRLMHTSVTGEQADHILKIVLPDRPKRDDQITAIIDRWHTSETVGFDWSGWGLLNAVSDYFEWGRAGGTPESRFVGALQGSTHAAINKTAAQLLLV